MEEEPSIITPEEFAKLIGIERQKQLKTFGINFQHNLEQWMTIISGEFEKAVVISNYLTLIIEGKYDEYEANIPFEIQKAKLKLRDQLLQISTCCLAVLQESPFLIIFK